MNVLFVTSHFGSSETIGFMPLISTELAKRNHEVQGVQYEKRQTIDSIPVDKLETIGSSTPHWAVQWLFYLDWEPKIREYINNHRPDVVVTDRRCTVPTIKAAVSSNVPVIGVVPGLGFTRFNPQNLRLDKTPKFRKLPYSAKVQYPFVKHLHHQHSHWIAKANGIVAVSEFLQDRLQNTYGIGSEVVRTPVVPKTVKIDTHRTEAITMVNPRTELKGGQIFISIAESMPEQEFLIAGDFHSKSEEKQARSTPNITCLGWVNDMREVYAKTAILVVPSLVEEGGPRVISEAFVNGIPVVGTTRGGIPEFIGNAGKTIDPPQDIEQWVAKIYNIFDNYDMYAGKASERSELFHINTAITTFEQILREAVE